MKLLRVCTVTVVTLVAALAAPLAASAATVSVVSVTGQASVTRPTLTYAAGAGEANRVTVTVERETVRDPDGNDFTELTWIVTEPAAPLVAGEGCTSIDLHHASCPAPRSPRDVAVAIALGDRDDWASAATACFFTEYPENGFTSCQTRLAGGAGNDTLFATDDDDVSDELSGGVGDDVLHGGGDLHGGPGRDRLLGDGYGGATFAGGPGADTMIGDVDEREGVLYRERVNAVRVTLNNRFRDDGGDGENDLVLNVEDVVTGAGNDVIVGTGRDNVVAAGAGSDLIRTAGGRDSIDGDAGGCDFRSRQAGGRDRIYAGSGPDSVLACGGNDLVHGGSGRDHLTGSAGRDRMIGGRGGDSLDGGVGNDRLFARDGARDILLGWRGFDRARIDRGLDVRRRIERLF